MAVANLPSSHQQAWEPGDGMQSRNLEGGLILSERFDVSQKVTVSPTLQRPFPEDVTMSPVCDLVYVVDCHQPVLSQIIDFLTPIDLINLCVLCSPLVARQSVDAAAARWKAMFEARWPAFHGCVENMGTTCWKHVYKNTLQGQLECTLEIFDREKKPEYAMSATPGKVYYDRKLDSFIVNYIRSNQVLPEQIPITEEHRLRFCPPSVRQALLRDNAIPSLPGTISEEYNVHYPYKVLEGISEELQVGTAVELQWKMQLGSPFGWWYGWLDALHYQSNRRAVATISFRHFHPDSHFYKLDVTFGDARLQSCDLGGYTGGLRPVRDAQEVRRWMHFFPKELVVS